MTSDVAVKASSRLIIPTLAVNNNVSLITASVTHSVIVPCTTFSPNAQIKTLFGLVILLFPLDCWI
ncbi:hypothetical protein HanRHA438_Chr14g0641901 [Helianthus annuus]|nr:hypothetical protein HanRHA438_Chr14g0641901 [Helianthus annuus]